MPTFPASAPLAQLLPGALEVASDPTSQAWLQLSLPSTVALGVFSLCQSRQSCKGLGEMCWKGSWSIRPLCAPATVRCCHLFWRVSLIHSR